MGLAIRCLTCGRLLNHKQLAKGVCLGHRLTAASEGSILEWLKIKWWGVTKQL